MTLAELIGSNASPAGEIVGYSARVPEWSLGGNDRFGDCTFVSLCNLVDLVTAVNGAPEVVGEAEAEYFYAREAGFDPNAAATDKGAVLADVIRYWQDNGWPTDPVNKPAGWCAITPEQIHQAVHSLGAVPAWGMLPYVGDDWDFSDVATSTATPGTGPHAFLIVGSSESAYKIVTWAEVKDVSHAWFQAYGRGQFAVRHSAWKVP